MTMRSMYQKIKLIGIKIGIRLYKKNGKVYNHLSPHKFRHTFATHLLNMTDNVILVKDQLGHEETRTTSIYARTLSEKVKKSMNDYSDRFNTGENSSN